MPCLAFLFCIFLFVVIFALFQFLIADGDLSLMSKGSVKREEFEDKVVWITGASRGIGEVIAKQLARLGSKLIISSRNEVDLERLKEQLTGKHASLEVKVLPMDLASGEESLREIVEKAESFFPGGIDYMVHNAAVDRPKSSVLDIQEKSMKETFDVNVMGTISITRILAPIMIKNGKGHFVVMSSAAGKIPTPAHAVYTASKHALNGYFHSLNSELCRKGIKVTIVCPGPIDTSTNSDAKFKEGKSPKEKKISSERFSELTLIAASHGMKEVWIAHQPVLALMYLVQYMPSIGLWILDKIGERRVEAAARNDDTYTPWLLFGMRNKSKPKTT